MKSEIRKLRKQLPTRGYAIEVKKKVGKGVTIYQIRNFFQGKPVEATCAEKIVKAAKKAIEGKRKQQEKIRLLMKAA